mmetsp:Transcript_37735/g.95425  ORF Transcript_37735/g.95425 Transcript_37735/m.95425 type:complete len:273 (-) Transcript_37735:564-1382(-)
MDEGGTASTTWLALFRLRSFCALSLGHIQRMKILSCCGGGRSLQLHWLACVAGNYLLNERDFDRVSQLLVHDCEQVQVLVGVAGSGAASASFLARIWKDNERGCGSVHDQQMRMALHAGPSSCDLGCCLGVIGLHFMCLCLPAVTDVMCLLCVAWCCLSSPAGLPASQPTTPSSTKCNVAVRPRMLWGAGWVRGTRFREAAAAPASLLSAQVRQQGWLESCMGGCTGASTRIRSLSLHKAAWCAACSRGALRRYIHVRVGGWWCSRRHRPSE